jgi:probable F420-dependent oxidoreductase
MSHARKFRFGICINEAASAADFRDRCRMYEDLGYSTIFVSDHFLDHPFGPMPALAYAAGVTSTIKLGTFVLGNDYRHPVVLASDIATVDLLSDGRYEWGIGAGWMNEDYQRAGIPQNKPSVRIARLAESITVIKGLLADGPFSFKGEYYTIEELDGQPAPVQRPHPPLFVGGGAKKILTLAAQEADIVGINANLRAGSPTDKSAAYSMTAAATDEKLGWVREAAGGRFDDLEIQTFPAMVMFTDDRADMSKVIGDSFNVSPEVALDTPTLLIGSEV